MSRISTSNLEDPYFAQNGLLLLVALVIPEAALLAFVLINVGLSKLPTAKARKMLEKYVDRTSSSTIDRGVLPKTRSRTSPFI